MRCAPNLPNHIGRGRLDPVDPARSAWKGGTGTSPHQGVAHAPCSDAGQGASSEHGCI